MRTLAVLLINLILCGCATNPQDVQNQQLAVIDTELMALDLQNHNPEAARMHLNTAQTLAPNDPQVLVAQGYFAEAMGDMMDAEKAYQAAIHTVPSDPNIENDYGTFLFHQGEYQQALSYFIAAASNPNNAVSAEAYENAGLDAKALGDNVAAKTYFLHAVQENPELMAPQN